VSNVEVLASEQREGLALRFAVQGRGPGGFQYRLGFVGPEERRPDDTVIEAGGFQVFVDPDSALHLNGVSVDYVESPEASGFKIDNPNPLWPDPKAQTVQRVLDEEINPAIAAHGGFVTLLDVKDDVVYIQMGGGCQGCGMVDVTLRQGIEVRITAINVRSAPIRVRWNDIPVRRSDNSTEMRSGSEVDVMCASAVLSMRAPQVHRLDSIPRRRARYALNFLPFAGCDFPIEEIAQERPNSCDGREPSDFFPGRRDRRADDVRSQLEREAGHQNMRVPKPDDARLHIVRRPGERETADVDDRAARAVRNHQDRDRLDGKRDVMGEFS
jgi:Fe/S biogenesis protein NfuA